MYDWITDKAFLSRMKTLCSDLVNQLVQSINASGEMEVRAYLVGSGARNMFTQNGNNPVDLDYNLEVIDCDDFKRGREIKMFVQKCFNEVLQRNGLDDCHDSTSALTTGKIHFTTGNQTEFSIDLCIVREDEDGWYRLKHDKYGNIMSDPFRWNRVRNSRGLDNRVAWLKEESHWQEVRDTYLYKKNMYLTRGDHDHPSFIVYIESVNEVYYHYNGGQYYG